MASGFCMQSCQRGIECGIVLGSPAKAVVVNLSAQRGFYPIGDEQAISLVTFRLRVKWRYFVNHLRIQQVGLLRTRFGAHQDGTVQHVPYDFFNRRTALGLA